MKRHAYLIIAHKNFEQLKKLLVLLDDAQNDIFILIDKKSVFDKNDFFQICEKSNVQFVKRIHVNWGGYSQIIAEMTLFRAASEYGTYVYYHLLSGMDLPLHNQDYIHAFFEKYEGYEFFTFTGRDIFEREKPERRIRYYYLLHDLPCGRLSGKIMTKIQDRLLIPVQRRLGVNRLRGKTFEVGYGANWVSVTDNFVRYLLSNEKKIRKIYKFSWCCDELYKHTLLLNSPFRDKVFISEGVHDRREDRQGNLRYINWWTGSPRTWRIEDQEELIEAAERGYLFSRKFDEQTDAMIIDYICDMVKHESGWKLNDQF